MINSSRERVLNLLCAIDGEEEAGATVVSWGASAVGFACELALGDWTEHGEALRRRAVTLVGEMDHPSAHETLAMLLTEDDSDMLLRAIRSIQRNRKTRHVATLLRLLRADRTAAVVALELVDTLAVVEHPDATAGLAWYRAGVGTPGHRCHPALVLACGEAPRPTQKHKGSVVDF